MNRPLTGGRVLMSAALRRDRVMLAVWIYGLAAGAIGTAYSFRSLYGTPAEQQQLAAGVAGNVSVHALVGTLYEPLSVAGLTAWRLGGLGAVLAAVMSVLLVVRHTRADEESGRLELVAAGVVGRFAPLAAALGVMLIANVLLAVVVFVGLVAIGFPVAGSVAFALGWLGAGLVFGGLAGVTAQLAPTARAANGAAMTAVGVSFLLRALGDSSGGASWLSWLSPIGWAQKLRPYTGDRFLPLLLSVTLALLAAGAAVVLQNRRDLGEAVFATRPGPAGSVTLTGPVALAWRLQRSGIVAWSIAMAGWGLAIGSMAAGVGELFGSSDQMRELLSRMGGSGFVIDAFQAATMGLAGLLVAVFGVGAVLRLRAEETAGRAELVLAGSVSRWRWAGGTGLIVVAGMFWLLLVLGSFQGVLHAIRMHDGGQFVRVLAAALVQFPAAAVCAALALLLFGLLPRFTAAAWFLLGLFLLLGQLGPVLQLPGWATDLSPFTFVPKLPGTFDGPGPLIWLAVVAAGVGVAGLSGWRRRDLG